MQGNDPSGYNYYVVNGHTNEGYLHYWRKVLG